MRETSEREVSLPKRAAAEFLGTLLLVATIVGSGIMAERLSGGNIALALLINTMATGAVLLALISTFGHLSGAQFNPAVTIAELLRKNLRYRESAAYISAQISGATCGTLCAHVMFGLSAVTVSQHARAGWALVLSEFVATFGLLSVIFGCARKERNMTAFAVAGFIVAAYWFTPSTSFANPAVTIARSLTDTFSGIRPADAPGFILGEIFGALAAALLFEWLRPEVKANAMNMAVEHLRDC